MAISEFERLVVTPRRSELTSKTMADQERLRVALGVDDAQPSSAAPEDSTTAPGGHSPSLMMLVLLATLGVLAYSVFLLNPRNIGDPLPYALVITAETILVVQALLAMWTILSSSYNPRDFAFYHAQDRLHDVADIIRDGTEDRPQDWTLFLQDKPVVVDVFITTYGEPLETIRKTVTAAVAMRGRHTVWVLDDGRSDDVRDLAAELGARYVRRLSSNGAKAGNVNHALALSRGDYFVIFDADFVPKPSFLVETVPFFVDERVAFVQTPQVYGNLNNVISRGAGYMQAVFYRFIQPGRNRFNAAFCVGTNVIFRRKAINDIGGMHTDSKSEDVWTSLMLHERGWRSIYIPMELAVGDTPETVEAYAKQQLRWATGGFEIMLQHNPLSPRRNLTMDQRLQYTVTATHYLAGICPLLLLLVPPLQIFFDLTPMNLTIGTGTWFLYYAGFYVMQIAIAFFTLGSFRWEVLMLATVSFPIYTKALWNAICRKEQSWHVTGRAGRATSPFNYMVPQVLFFWFLLLTTAVGGWKDWNDGTFSLALAWNATNTLILGGFLLSATREAREIAQAARAEKRASRRARRVLGDRPAPTEATASSDLSPTGGAR
ncbi:glycosyltransferase family 2 protein [Sanguibacter suaedae]|nr:cellulose synthase catalytic subunit [Sanguibacter suaedae]